MFKIKLSILLLSCALVTACNFRPVHGQESSNITSQLAQVDVITTNDSNSTNNREGQVLKYKLLELLNPANSGSSPVYKLEIALSEDKSNLGIQENLSITRYDIIENADYKLIYLPTNAVLTSGKAHIKSSFNRTESEFSTFVAEEDAKEKAAEEMAQELKQRLVAYFSK